MEHSLDLTRLDRPSIVEIAVATIASFLLVTAVGSVVNVAFGSSVSAVYSNANRAVPFVVFGGNALTLLGALWLLGRAVAFGHSSQAAPFLPVTILRRNTRTLELARFVTVIGLIQLCVGLFVDEARGFLFVAVANATPLDFRSITWDLLLGLVLPMVLLVAILFFTSRAPSSAH